VAGYGAESRELENESESFFGIPFCCFDTTDDRIPPIILKPYRGLPYRGSRYQGGSQKIPGRVLCAYYDLGGRVWRITTRTHRITAAES